MHPFHNHQIMHIQSIQLLIQHIPRSLAFYQDILGFHVLFQDDHQVHLSADGIHPIIYLIKDDHALPLSITQGLYHAAILMPTRSALANVIQQLSEKRYPITGASDHGVSEAIYLDDPDGHGLEIYCDRNKESWPYQDGHLEMYTKALDIADLMKHLGKDPYRSIDPNAVIGHLHFHVPNLKQAEDFYCKVLGFSPIMLYMKSALFISDGGYHHHLGLNTWNGDAPLRKDRQVGLIGYELIVPQSQYIDLVNRLREAHMSLIIEDELRYVIDPLNQRCIIHVV